MVELVLSGGQTGADMAGLRAARAAGIPTGGWAPLGFLTEDGAAPWLADWGLKECDKPGYPARTGLNVRQSDATLVFSAANSPGTELTCRECRREGKPLCRVGIYRTFTGPLAPAGWTTPASVAAWLRDNRVKVLNVAGTRESKAPGVGAAVEAFLGEVFRLLKGGASGG